MFKSGLKGKSVVIFGGKVGISIGRFMLEKQPHVSVGLEESKCVREVGKYYKCDDEEVIPPVKLVFTKVESIDSVINVLTQAKERLKMEIDTFEEESTSLDWDIINRKNVIIKCKDENEASLFLKACEEEGFHWLSGLKPSKASNCYREFSTNEGKYITESHDGFKINFEDVLSQKYWQ